MKNGRWKRWLIAAGVALVPTVAFAGTQLMPSGGPCPCPFPCPF